MKLPRWSDKKAVAKFVNQEMDDADLEDDRQFYMRYANCDVPGPTFGDIFRPLESRAVMAARNGDFSLLADLLDPRIPLHTFLRTAGFSDGIPFSDEALVLIADRLVGRFKPPPGRRKMLPDRRNSQAFEASEEFLPILRILKRYWPDEMGLREEALEISARRNGIPRDTLANHRNRPKKDRRRLYRG